MTPEEQKAVAETAARAKEFLRKRDDLKGADPFVPFFMLYVVLPPATKGQELEGSLYFDWKGSTRVYRKDIADALIVEAEGDAFTDKVLCAVAATMLEAVGGIPDVRLRSYVGARLFGGLNPRTKRVRGQKKTSNNYRDAVIVGYLVWPLLDRFSATRNRGTKYSNKGESACSITEKALAIAGTHISEKRLENIWARFAHLYVPTK